MLHLNNNESQRRQVVPVAELPAAAPAAPAVPGAPAACTPLPVTMDMTPKKDSGMTGAGTGAGAGAGTGPSLVPRTAGLALAGVANTWACVERGDRVVHNHTGDPRRLAVKKARNTSVMDTSRTHTLHFFIIHGLGYPFIRGCAVYSLQNNTHRYNATQTPHTPQIHNNTKTAGGGGDNAVTQEPTTGDAPETGRTQ